MLPFTDQKRAILNSLVRLQTAPITFSQPYLNPFENIKFKKVQLFCDSFVVMLTVGSLACEIFGRYAVITQVATQRCWTFYSKIYNYLDIAEARLHEVS